MHSMLRTRQLGRRALLLALVGGAHVVLYGLVSTTVRSLRPEVIGERIAAILIVRREAPATAPGQALNARAPRAALRTIPSAAGETQSPPAVGAPPPAPDGHVDWDAESARIARDAGAAGGRPDARGFGFPGEPEAAPRNRSQFGWSHGTGRVEWLPTGGVLVKISDYCVIGVVPLPVFGCALGKRRDRTDLLEQMHSARTAGDWKDSR
jgi:hypothetical protein